MLGTHKAFYWWVFKKMYFIFFLNPPFRITGKTNRTHGALCHNGFSCVLTVNHSKIEQRKWGLLQAKGWSFHLMYVWQLWDFLLMNKCDNQPQSPLLFSIWYHVQLLTRFIYFFIFLGQFLWWFSQLMITLSNKTATNEMHWLLFMVLCCFVENP